MNKDDVMATIDLAGILDKEHASKSLHEILKLPPSALHGVTAKDAEALQAAFGIKTIADMGRNKFFKVAQGLAAMADYEKATA